MEMPCDHNHCCYQIHKQEVAGISGTSSEDVFLDCQDGDKVSIPAPTPLGDPIKGPDRWLTIFRSPGCEEIVHSDDFGKLTTLSQAFVYRADSASFLTKMPTECPYRLPDRSPSD